MEEQQRTHFDSIGAAYDAHYSDSTSERYRELFVNKSLTEDLDLEGREVLEAMCGVGSTAGHLLSLGAHLTGLDISPKQISGFRRKWPQARAVEGSIRDTGLTADRYDCVIVVGGLHHVQPLVQDAVDEIWRVLKPGGFFCFAEPHSGSLPDIIRRRWYVVDPIFQRDEKSIDLAAMEAKNQERFEFVRKHYRGNLAYLFVFNSLVFRVPLRLKRFYAPVLLRLEAILGHLQGRRLSCFVVCQWRKRPFTERVRT